MAAERAPLLCVFAKAPLAGAVKTRLQKKCGAAVAAQIAAALAEETVRRARCHWPGQVCVYGHGAGHDSFLSQLARRHQAALRPQAGADLGERMADALRADGVPAQVVDTRLGDARYKVRVGPLATKAEAQRMAQRLTRERGLDTWVVAGERR